MRARQPGLVTRFRALLAILLGGGLLSPAAGRADAPPPPPPAPVPAPAPAGAPAAGRSIEVPDASPWLDAAGPRLVGVSTDGTRLFFTNRVKGVVQLFVTDADGKAPRALTSRPQSITFAVPSPDGSKVVVGYDHDGDENTALSLLDVGAEPPVEAPLAGKPGVQCGSVVWTPEGDRIFYRANDADRAVFRIHELPIAAYARDEVVFDAPGSWRVEDAGRGGERLLLVRERSNRDAALFLFHVGTRALTEIHPSVTGPTSAVGRARFAGGGGLVAFTQEYRWEEPDTYAEAWAFDVATGATVPTPRQGDGSRHGCIGYLGDVEAVAASPDGARVHLLKNAADAADRLAVVDVATNEEVTTLACPPGELAGLFATSDGRLFSTNSSPSDPGSILRWSPGLLPESRDHVIVRLPSTILRSDLGPLDASSVPEAPQAVEIPTTDGTRVPAWLWLPKGKDPKNLPFVLSIHGGPEGEDRPGWHPDRAYLLSLGFGVLAPNVRGSTGHGRRFRDADDGAKRMDAVRDAKAAAGWLVEKGYADPKRLGVMGGSYGGFMVLALLTEYPDTFAAGAEAVGIANFETFLEQTAPYRRALREAEYGSLSDREFLRSISPIHKVDRIRAPLLIAHGEHDPRVPVGEARQIEAGLRRLGRPVEALYFPDEGHGWKKPANRKRHLETVARFFLEHLGPK